MLCRRHPGRRFQPRFWRALAAPVLFALAGEGRGGEPPVMPKEPPAVTLSAPAGVLDLTACRRLSLAKQPWLAAAQASLSAAEARARGVAALRVPTCLQPDLPIRRHQSTLGVGIAEAGVRQAEAEAIYAVTRNYFSILFAREQREVAEQVLKNLNDLKDSLAEVVKSGSRANVTARHVEKVGVYLQVVQARIVEAEEGVQRANAALREALGVGREGPLILVDSRLPNYSVAVDLDQVLAPVLARRGELTQVNLAVQLTAEEVEAQGMSRRPTSARLPPHPTSTPSRCRKACATASIGRRPALEMPTSLVGSKAPVRNRCAT